MKEITLTLKIEITDRAYADLVNAPMMDYMLEDLAEIAYHGLMTQTKGQISDYIIQMVRDSEEDMLHIMQTVEAEQENEKTR